MVWGKYCHFNLTLRKRYTCIVFRLLVHSFMTINDIEFTWLTARKLKIRVAWPDWWFCPEQQTKFDTDQAGVPTYSIAHELIGDIMENNEARKSADGRVWDDGYIVFDRNMSLVQGETDIKLKKLEVTSANQHGLFIQVKVQVDLNEKEVATPMKAMLSAGIATPGAGQGGKTSHLTRKLGDSSDEDDGDTKRPKGDTNISIATDDFSQALDDILTSPPAPPEPPEDVASMEFSFDDDDDADDIDVDIDGFSL